MNLTRSPNPTGQTRPLGAALNPKADLWPQLEAFAQAGFQYVDLAMDFPVTSENLDAAKLANALRTHGLSFHGQTPVLLPFGSPYEEIRKNAVNVANKAVHALEAAGAQTVVFHPDGAYGFLPLERIMAWNAESLAAVYHAAASRTVILVENLHAAPFNEAETLQRLIHDAGMDGRTGINVDVSHAFIGQTHGGSTLVEFLKTGQVKHIHLSDNDGQRDLHLPLGQGKIDWTTVKKQLKTAGYAEGGNPEDITSPNGLVWPYKPRKGLQDHETEGGICPPAVLGVTIECYAGGIQGILDSKIAWEKT